MKTKLLLFFFCLSVLGSMGQGTITRNKCKTCGQVVSQCPYKGRHPKPQQEKPKQETLVDENNTDIPKVSVIIPVYNGEKYIEACLDSVFAGTQTDIEVIVVDNASTDGTEKKLEQLNYLRE